MPPRRPRRSVNGRLPGRCVCTALAAL